MDGIERIAAERKRHVQVEGWTAQHDDQHVRGELAAAGASYADIACKQARGVKVVFKNAKLSSIHWPWHRDWWKPSSDPIRNLEKAGALIAAEIDRLLREKG